MPLCLHLSAVEISEFEDDISTHLKTTRRYIIRSIYLAKYVLQRVKCTVLAKLGSTEIWKHSSGRVL